VSSPYLAPWVTKPVQFTGFSCPCRYSLLDLPKMPDYRDFLLTRIGSAANLRRLRSKPVSTNRDARRSVQSFDSVNLNNLNNFNSIYSVSRVLTQIDMLSCGGSL
jgi:hypothetical protein